MLSPWVILAIVLAFIGVGGGGYAYGDHHGALSQKVADQKQFDSINAQTATNKATANAIYQNAQAVIIQQAKDRALSDNQREQERQSNVKAINDLRTKYASNGLHFSTGQTSGLGNCSPSTVPISANPAGHTETTVCAVSNEVDASLKSIAYDADTLAADYTILYNWAHDPNLCK